VESLIFPQNDIEAPAPAMALVCAPYRSNARSMARMGQPIMHDGANSAAHDWRFALALMPCNQKQNPVASGNRSLQRSIDFFPCSIQAMAMQIEYSVRLHPAGSQTAIPAAI